MAITQSQLSIIVESKGIEAAAKSLKDLAAAGASADKEVLGLAITHAKAAAEQAKAEAANAKATKTLERNTAANAASEAAEQRRIQALGRAQAQAIAEDARRTAAIETRIRREEEAAARAEAAAQRQIQSYGRMQDQANRMNDALDKKGKAFEEVSKRGNVYVNTLRSMATAASAYLGVNFVRGIVAEADAWSMAQSKLKITLGDMNLAKQAQENLYQTAQKLRVPLEDVAKLFTRMYPPLQKMGYSMSDTNKTVESFSMALRLAGATGQEASSAMLQFSQSINAGRLNGGEFNSVAEAAPNVLRAIEAELVRSGKAADIYSINLKKLAGEGKLTTDVLVKSLLNASAKWREDFANLPLTVDGALTRIKNAWEKAIGQVGQDTGFTKRISEALTKLEEALPDIAKAIGNTFAFLVENAKTLTTVFTSLVALGTVKWLAESAVAFKSLASEIGLTNVVLQAFAAHPVVRIVLGIASVVGVAGVAAYKLYKDATEGATVANENLTKTAPELIQSIEAQYQAALKQYKVLYGIAELEDKRSGKGGVQHIQDATELEQMMDKIQRKTEEYNIARKNGSEVGMKQAQTELVYLSTEYGKMKDKLDVTEQLNKANAAQGKLKSDQKAFDELFLKYGQTESEQRKQKIKELDEVAKRDGVLIMDAKKYNQILEGINEKFKDKPKEDPFKPMKESLEKSKTLTEEWVQKLDQLKQYGVDDKRLEAQKRLNELEREAISITNSTEKALNEKEQADVKRRLNIQQQYELEKKLQEAWKERLANSDKELATVQEEVLKQQDLLEAYGKTEQELNNLSEKRAMDTLEKEKSILTDMKLYSSNETEIAQQQKIVDNLSEIIEGRKKIAQIKDTIASKEEVDKKAEEYEKAYQSANKKIEDGLYAAIGRGGTNAVKKLIEDLRSWFARLVLKPIIDPIAAFGASIISPNAQSATGGGDILGNLAKAGSSLWESFAGAGSTFGSTGFMASLAGGLNGAGAGSGLTSSLGLSIGNSLNSVLGSSLSGSLSTAVSAISSVAPFLAAFQAFKNINGGYQIGGLSKDLQAATLGIAPRLFGMQDKQMTGQTVTGNLGTQDLSRNVAWSQKGGLFRSDRSGVWSYGLKDSTAIQDGKAYVDTASLASDKALLNQLNSTYDALKVSTAELAKSLGMNADDIMKRTDAINFTFGKDAAETSANINKVFDTIANTISKDLLGGLTSLSKVGETSYQTLARLSTTMGTVNSIFETLGYAVFKIDDAGIKAADSLVTLYGGLDKFKAVTQSYYDNFYKESEKTEKATKAVTQALKDLGIKETIDTREKFREQVDTALKNGNNELVKSLMELSGAFAQVVQWTEEAKKSADELAGRTFQNGDMNMPDVQGMLEFVTQELKSIANEAERWYNIRNQSQTLVSQIDDFIGNPKKDPAIRMKQLWDSLSKDISAEQKLAIANELKDLTISKYQLEKDSLTKQKEQLQKIVDLGKQLRNYVTSLKLGNLAPLNQPVKLDIAKNQFDVLLAKARGGDTEAMSALQDASQTYLQLAQTALTSSQDYIDIFNEVTNSLDSLGLDNMSAADQSISLATDQLTELNKLRDYAASLETSSNAYYNSSLDLFTKQSQTAIDLYNRLGNLDGLSPILATLPADIASNLADKLASMQNANADFVKGLYGQYAGKTGGMIDAFGMKYWVDEVVKYGRDYVVTAFQNAVAGRAPAIVSTPQYTNDLIVQVVALTEEVKALREEQQQQTGDLIAATIVSNNDNATTIIEAQQDLGDKKSWVEQTRPELV